MSGHVCGACNTPVTGADALCPPCWALVPRDERQVFMTVWRQVQAKLLPEAMLVAVTSLLHGYVKHQLADLRNPQRLHQRIARGKHDDLIMAALPVTSALAVTASELTQRVGVLPGYTVTNWLTINRGVHPRLASRDINQAHHHGRPRYVYWALPANQDPTDAHTA